MEEKGNAKKRTAERLLQRDGAAVRKRVEWLGRTLLWVGIGYLFGIGKMLFGTNPMGLALLCAGGKGVIGVLIGLIVAELALMESPVLMICTYAAAGLSVGMSVLLLEAPGTRVPLPARLQRILSVGEKEGAPMPTGRFRRAFFAVCHDTLSLFTAGMCWRIATAAVCALTVSLVRIISGGFRYYDLFAALFLIVVSAAAVPILSVVTEGRERHPAVQTLSAAVFLLVTVWSADFTRIGSVSPAAVLAVLFTLLATERHGLLWGCIAGGICGLAYQPMLAPAYLLVALLYGGLPWKRRESLGVAAASLSAVLWSAYVNGWKSFAGALAASLVGGACFTLLCRLSLVSKEEKTEEQTSPREDLRCVQLRHNDANLRLRDISQAFSSLSEMLYNLSDRLRRPGTLDLRRICDTAFDVACTDCPNKTVCWGLEYAETFAVMGKLISQLHTKGRVDREQIPPHLLRRCPSMDGILKQIDRECARLTAELLRNDRMEIFAMDYEGAAQIIEDALAEDGNEYRFDPELETRLSVYLSDAGIGARSVSVYGMRRRQLLIRGVELDATSVTLETLRSDLGEMCGLELGKPVFEVEGGATTMRLQAKRRFSVQGAQRNLSAGEGVSGDCVNLFTNRKDFFYALISDGMGAGREAAFASNLCSAFLEEMLRAGNRASTALKMLNNLICSRSADSATECSATVDLMELDLITGTARFTKSGAAPCFVIREGRVHRLQAGSFPIGIIGQLNSRTVEHELKRGDTVVMVSDGILQEDTEGNELEAYLATVWEKEPEELVELLCQRVAEREARDDCSAVALRIGLAEE
ncbi:MAG: hypothetical protein E7620_03475 [Ruminococcaceae bacterium]|nr:hypothetical protein [Oscillospiraceae bacterium]